MSVEKYNADKEYYFSTRRELKRLGYKELRRPLVPKAAEHRS